MAEDEAERAEVYLGADNTRVSVEIVARRGATDDPPRACAEAFVEAVRLGVLPVSDAADRMAARIVDERTVGEATTLDIALPRMPESSLAPLVHLLRHGPGGVQRLHVRSIADPAQALRKVERFDAFAQVKAPFDYAPVPTHRDELKYGALRVQFEGDLPEAAGPSFEAAVRAWFKLVELHGFRLGTPRPSGRREMSSGLLADAADAFPDEWVFSYQFLRVDEVACRPLLRYLVELHASCPILEVAFE